MKIDYLDVDNKSTEEKEKKKAEFIKRLKAAIKKQENKENKKDVGTNKKKGTRSSKTNKSK
ncbi:MAG: hypothetical protein VZQ62_00105 [Methanosphaera sp.]|jgi:hypothetical protein|nr:hypothetical protein [Methanosphaera sp.]